jgi:hypothetical protein
MIGEIIKIFIIASKIRVQIPGYEPVVFFVEVRLQDIEVHLVDIAIIIKIEVSQRDGGLFQLLVARSGSEEVEKHKHHD